MSHTSCENPDFGLRRVGGRKFSVGPLGHPAIFEEFPAIFAGGDGTGAETPKEARSAPDKRLDGQMVITALVRWTFGMKEFSQRCDLGPTTRWYG